VGLDKVHEEISQGERKSTKGSVNPSSFKISAKPVTTKKITKKNLRKLNSILMRRTSKRKSNMSSPNKVVKGKKIVFSKNPRVDKLLRSKFESKKLEEKSSILPKGKGTITLQSIASMSQSKPHF
jgi:hypothetical protein